MYSLRRWWDRHQTQILLTSLALGTAVFLQQTGGSVVFEVYRFLARPFQSAPIEEGLMQNARLQEYQQRLEELESQNQRLKELLGFTSNKPKSGIAAPVVGRSADHWWQQVLLGRGESQGVKTGDVVMAPGGLIGRVFEVTPNTARVLLLSDPSSRVGVTVSRSRFMGYLRGTSANRAVMEFFDKVPDVRQGDMIVTSSFSRLFPAGLPVGRVESIDLTKSPAPEAVVVLSAPINSLEWAIISPHEQLSVPPSSGTKGSPESSSKPEPAL